jgi:hypothetical protein
MIPEGQAMFRSRPFGTGRRWLQRQGDRMSAWAWAAWPGTLELSGRISTLSGYVPWSVVVARGRIGRRLPGWPVTATSRLGEQPGWSVVSSRARERRAAYVLSLATISDHEPSHDRVLLDDGVVVDLDVMRSGNSLRIIGFVSETHPPSGWHDDESPTFLGYGRISALDAGAVWLGIFDQDGDLTYPPSEGDRRKSG